MKIEITGRCLLRCLFFTIVLLCAVGFYEEIVAGSALNWAFHQRHYWNSVIEIGLLVVALFLVFLFVPKRGICFSLAGAILLTFSYLHSFFYAFVVAAIYAVMIWLTGRSICLLIVKRLRDEPIACFVLGMAGLIILVAVCSILKVGTPDKLRMIYVTVFGLEIVFNRDVILRKADVEDSDSLLSTTVACKSVHFINAIHLAGIIAAFMIQVGRANIALDYDSAWYGIRSDRVLAPYTGIYDQLMMTGCVYVYTKGIETLSLAFSFPNTYSYIYAVNLMFAAVTLYVVYKTVGIFASKNQALFATLCCSVTAGIMNMASTAKSDISTLLLQVAVLYYGIKAIKEGSGKYFMPAFAAGVLSFAFKPSSVIFTTIIMATILAVAILGKVRADAKDWPAVCICFIAVALLFARTYLLAGIPFASFGKSLWSFLGMEYKYPYGASVSYMMSIAELLEPDVFIERLIRLYSFMFSPITEELDHVIIAWAGELFAFVWIATVLHIFLRPRKTVRRMKENPVYMLSLLSLATVSVASMGCVMLMSKPDGNYFMLMYAMTFIHAELEWSVDTERTLSIRILGLVPLVVCGMLMCMASHWSWTFGLTPISLNNDGCYHHEDYYMENYRNIGIDQIVSVLSEEEKMPRVLIASNNITEILTIPAVADTWLDLTHWGNAKNATSGESLYEYLRSAQVEYLLVDINVFNSDERLSNGLQYLCESGYVQLHIEQGTHWLLRFNPSESDVDEQLMDLIYCTKGV